MNPDDKRLAGFLNDLKHSSKGERSSFFEEESKRIAALNKDADKPTLGQKLLLALFAVALVGIFVVPLTAYGILVTGFVATKLWSWFLVPLGLPSIGILHAAGIATLVRLFTAENPFAAQDSAERVPEDKKMSRTITLILIPWATLLIGYIVHRCM